MTDHDNIIVVDAEYASDRWTVMNDFFVNFHETEWEYYLDQLQVTSLQVLQIWDKERKRHPVQEMFEIKIETEERQNHIFLSQIQFLQVIDNLTEERQ